MTDPREGNFNAGSSEIQPVASPIASPISPVASVKETTIQQDKREDSSPAEQASPSPRTDKASSIPPKFPSFKMGSPLVSKFNLQRPMKENQQVSVKVA